MDKLEYIPGDIVKIEYGEAAGKIGFVTNAILKRKGSYGLFVFIGKEFQGSSKDDWISTYNDEVSPIPLTPEILEKNGWKLHKHHERNSYDDVSWSSYHKPAETNISLIFYQEEKAFFPFLYAQEISETPIRYIHQLQHILFGLKINHEIKI